MFKDRARLLRRMPYVGLLQLIAAHFPRTLKLHVAKIYYRIKNCALAVLRREIVPRLVDVNRAYPAALEVNLAQSRTVPVSQLAGAALVKDALHLEGSTYTVPRDFVALLKGAMYCSRNGAVLTKDGRFIQQSVNTLDSFRHFHVPLPRSYLEAPVRLHNVVSPLRSRFNNHYHTLADNLPRLVALAHAPQLCDGPVSIIYSGALSHVEQFLVPRLIPDWMKLVQVDQGPVYEPKALLFTPFKTRDHAGFLPQRYVNALRGVAWPNRPSRSHRRIFISRKNAPMATRRILNEEELLKMLDSLDVEVCSLEEMPFEQQVALFYDAELVIAPHGAGLTNMIFSAKAKILELFGTPLIAPHYLLMAESLGHEYRSVCAKGHAFNDGFKANLEDVATALESLGVTTLR